MFFYNYIENDNISPKTGIEMWASSGAAEGAEKLLGGNAGNGFLKHPIYGRIN
jgi:hypothetical protein